MNGLRYYVGTFLILTAAASTYAAEHKESKQSSPQLKVHTLFPRGSKRVGNLYMSSRTFYITVPTDAKTIAAIKDQFKKEVEALAHQQPTCSCGGPCADIRAAKVLVAHHADKKLHFAYLGAEADDAMSLEALHKKGFNEKDDVLYAQYS